MYLGFKARIYVSVAVLLSASLIILGLLNNFSLKEKMLSSLIQKTEHQLANNVTALEQNIHAGYSGIRLAAEHFSAKQSDEENLTKVRLLADSLKLNNVIVAYNDGRSFMSAVSDDGIATSSAFSDINSSWYLSTKATLKNQFTEIYTDDVTGDKVLGMTAPIVENGIFVGALLGELPIQSIIDQVSNMRFAGGAATLTDQNAVFFASDDPNDIGKTPSQVSPVFTEMEQAFSQKSAGHLTFPYLGIQFDGYFQRVQLAEGQHWTLMVFVDQATAFAGIEQAQRDAFFTGIALLLCSFIAIFVILNHAYKPLLKLKAAVGSLSHGSGDLTAELDVIGNDDLADISKGFNSFVENLRNMMIQISTSSQNISANISQLADNTQGSESILVSHSEQTEQVVTAISEMSQSAKSVADNVHQSKELTDTTSQEANHSLHIVTDAVSTVNELITQVDNMSDKITNMTNDTNQISDVLNVIGEISEQTNLLALNAAIEAARAGEQGRGFAVVADEVRQLAGRTQNSTTEISEMLSKLREGTQNVVNAMEETKQQCQSTAAQTSKVSESLNLMSNSVKQIDDISSHIATATVEQSTVAEELSVNMLSIKEIVDSLLINGKQTVSATQSLSESNVQLEKLVANFKLY